MGFQSLVWKKVVAGIMAGGIGQLMASPTDLVKTQIHMIWNGGQTEVAGSASTGAQDLGCSL